MPHNIEGIIRIEQRSVLREDADLFYEEVGDTVFVFLDEGLPIKNPMGKIVTAPTKEIAELLISDFELRIP